MSSLHVHRLPERACELSSRARILLTAGPEHLRKLAGRLGDAPEGPISLTFTGQYNAGKSTLIRALTGLDDIVVDSNVATTAVTTYQWGQVLLTDTPGVQAGVREHDEAAERALHEADLVVFVLSVDLFDDAGSRHLDHVAHELGKRRSMVVVVNKIGTLDADPAIRLAAVHHALGQGMSVSVVLTDAKEHLDALVAVDPDDAADMFEIGNIDDLEDALNDLVARSGQDGRLRRPFEKIIAVCAHALEALTTDPDDAVARAVINRQRRLVTGSRRRLDRAFDTRILDFRRSMHQLGEDLADAVDQLDQAATEDRSAAVDRAEQTFRARAGDVADRLVTDLRRDVKREATVAAEELRELAGSPQVEHLVGDGLDQKLSHRTAPVAVNPTPTEPGGAAQVLRKIGNRAGQMSSWWGTGSSTKDFAGSTGHKLVYDLGKRLGKDFKPWEAVRYAETVGKGARYINKAMPYVAIGADVLIAIKADRAESAFIKAQQSRRRSIAARVQHSVNEVEGEVRARVDSAMADFFGQALAKIEEQQAELDALLMGRSDLREGLAQVVKESADELTLLDRMDAPREDVSTLPTTGTAPQIPGGA